MSFKYRLPADYEIVKIPTNKARRAECIQLSEYLKDSLYDLTRIDGIVSYGIGISKTNWSKSVIQVKITNKLPIKEQVRILEKIMSLDNITSGNVELSFEKERKGRHDAFGGERIRPDKPRKWDGS